MKKLLMFFFAIIILASCNNNKKNPRFNEGDGDGGWTNKVRNKYLKDCIDASGDNVKLAKQVCSCVLEKVEKKYTVAEVEELSEAVGARMARECMEGVGEDEDDFGNRKKKDVDEDQDESWTNQQRNQYIQECAGAAETNLGYTSQQANSFCECMTRKVERKHSYREASRMTATDFSTQEWEDARTDCKANANY